MSPPDSFPCRFSPLSYHLTDNLPPPLPQLFTKMVIKICAKAGEWKTAGYLLIEMRREGQLPDAASYAIAMRACLEAGEKSRALGLWEEMTQAGVVPNKEASALAMSAALDLRDWERVDAMMEALPWEGEGGREVGREGGAGVANQGFFQDLMAGFVENGRWRSALHLLRVLGQGEREDGREVKPSTDLEGAGKGGGSDMGGKGRGRKTPIGGHGATHSWLSVGFYEQAVQACAVAGRTEEAIQTLSRMESMGFRPTTFIYNVVMEACSKAKDLPRALALKRRMQSTQVEFDVVSCNTLLNAFAVCGRWDEALSFLQRMPGHYHVSPNLVSYNTALKACVVGRRWREAVMLLNSMRAQRVDPDAVSYRTAMNACIEGGEARRALKIFDRMREDGIPWDVPTYNVVLKACAEGHQPDMAWVLFQQMQAAGLVAEVRTYTTVMNAWVEAGECQRAIQTFQEMRAAGLQPDVYAWTVGIKACGACGLVETALAYVEETLALQPRLPLDPITFNLAMQVCEEHGAETKALGLFHRMQAEAGVEPNWITYGIVLRILTRTGQWPQVQELFNTIEARLPSSSTTPDTPPSLPPPLPSSVPSSSSSYLPYPSSDSFFSEAMRRIVAAGAWDLAGRVFDLAVTCGAIAPPPPPSEPSSTASSPPAEGAGGGGEGGGGGGHRRLEKCLYGGAVAAAVESGAQADVDRFVTGLCGIMQGTEGGRAGGRERWREEYLRAVEACGRSKEWSALLDFHVPGTRSRGGQNAWQPSPRSAQERWSGEWEER